MQVIPIKSEWVGERLDKFVMKHFKMPWAASQRLIRSKKAFVVQSATVEEEGKEEPKQNTFVYRDATYKIG